MAKEIDLENIGTYIKALHCQIRWVLIDILGDGPKTTEEILNHLKNASENIDSNAQCHGMCGKGDFKNLQKPTLYYHLRELESVKIIKSDNKPSGGKGAPVKEWKLNMEKLTINLK
jgi:hypothetical protein